MAKEDLPPSSNEEGFPLKTFLQENLLVLIFGFFGLLFLVLGIFFFDAQKRESGIVFEESAKAEEGKIKIDIEGAVVKPGVYELSVDSRVQEVLILAGGLSSSADREWLAKNLNLAAKLSDGAKFYIPHMGEKSGILNNEAGIKGNMISEKININTASSSELDQLSGVGPVTAQKIIDGRPYQAVEDLLNKKIVGASTFSKIKDQVTLW